jgi:dolichol kinase
LLVFWFFLFACTSLVLSLQWFLVKSNISTSKSLTATRKQFHILICCVYLPGLLFDRHFLYLCSYGMLILLGLLETIRYFKVVYLADRIDYLMKLFVDEKDREGKLILSHIYLLIGFSFPIWISTSKKLHISEFSGLLTIGIGDTFASLVGSQIGKHKWPNSHRSIEGTLSFIISQLIAYYLFYLYGIFDIFYNFNFIYINMSLFISAFVEAFTGDNDSLLLSIVTYPILLLI